MTHSGPIQVVLALDRVDRRIPAAYEIYGEQMFLDALVMRCLSFYLFLSDFGAWVVPILMISRQACLRASRCNLDTHMLRRSE